MLGLKKTPIAVPLPQIRLPQPRLLLSRERHKKVLRRQVAVKKHITAHPLEGAALAQRGVLQPETYRK